MTEAAPRRTAHHDGHVELGARHTEFSGWHMPLRYGGILEEHIAVREAAGLFDLSHMGEVWVNGPDAALALATAIVSDPARLAVGRAQYSLLCNDEGGIIDDLIIYRMAEDEFLVVPNAANTHAAAHAISQGLSGLDASLDDATMRTSLVAVQGPRAATILSSLTDLDLDSLRYYAALRGEVASVSAIVARTGYTGEDGFELFVEWNDGPRVWEALSEAGEGAGIRPCGLAARDTLRLEAGMPLYGNELGLDINPYEAGLGRVVKLDKAVEFRGRRALEALAAAPLRRTLVGLRLGGRAIARHGNDVVRPRDEAVIGAITSGSQSPTLGEPIAMAYVPPADAQPGTMLAVTVRDTAVAAEVVPLPFYRRPGR